MRSIPPSAPVSSRAFSPRMNSNIPTILGRLLAELSWEGTDIKSYRQGGRGYENVLTTEVLQALDFLPRATFLGSIIASLHGSGIGAVSLLSEIEEAKILVLPGDMILSGENIRLDTERETVPQLVASRRAGQRSSMCKPSSLPSRHAAFPHPRSASVGSYRTTPSRRWTACLSKRSRTR
jgi:hypothetical protein